MAAAKEHRLMVQRCTGCGALRFPPREICSRCLSSSAEWTNVSGRGEIFSFNVMHQVYHPAFAREVPYAVIVVKLAEGPKITSNLLDCPIDRIKIGMPVEVVFEQISDAVTLPKFRVRAQS
ncbi:MAG: Zn-ribbon domain-containing OB-fold protein [Dehalococcoidia bacterium]|nr:Zn-ribbon domain-containing OB-fold protein [Dehalococcoidia bacterium]